MNTAKKTWVTPKATLEEFTPNEYVFSSCWTVACKVGAEGNYGGYDWSHWNGKAPVADANGDINNHGGDCSKAVNNQFRVNNDGTVEFVTETTSTTQGNLSGSMDSFLPAGSIGIGTTIFWHTNGNLDVNDKRRWNHYGTVEAADPSHPNRS
nr:hypothetical protein [uncultured Faecalibacillus sp.]